MSEKFNDRLNTVFPVAGGGIGALTQAGEFVNYFPSWETIAASIIITCIGGVFGYFLKMLLDKLTGKK